MIQQFITVTQRFIQRNGFDDYEPTLVLPQRKDIRLLQGVPPDVDMEAAATDWATRATDAEEDFFLAFKTDESHFKVIARIKGEVYEELCQVALAATPA
jgi:hypothetical protein